MLLPPPLPPPPPLLPLPLLLQPPLQLLPLLLLLLAGRLTPQLGRLAPPLEPMARARAWQPTAAEDHTSTRWDASDARPGAGAARCAALSQPSVAATAGADAGCNAAAAACTGRRWRGAARAGRPARSSGEAAIQGITSNQGRMDGKTKRGAQELMDNTSGTCGDDEGCRDQVWSPPPQVGRTATGTATSLADERGWRVSHATSITYMPRTSHGRTRALDAATHAGGPHPGGQAAGRTCGRSGGE